MNCSWLVAILVSTGLSHGQLPHLNAHAHNDYEHTRPLFDALDQGFRSVEVDIHRVGDRLYVGHNHPVVNDKHTLQYLYLNPLDSLARSDEGRRALGTVTLLIDIKTDATRTLQQLLAILEQYPRLLAPGHSSPVVRLVISGKRDYDLILKSKHVSIDGRPSDLGKGYARPLRS
jgi:hypothetical protein